MSAGLPMKLAPGTQERIAQIVVIAPQATPEQLHKALLLVCQMAFCDGAKAALDRARAEAE